MKAFFGILVFGFWICSIGCAHQQKQVKVESKSKKDPYYYLIRSNLESYEGDSVHSIADLQKALSSEPGNPYLHYMLADRYAQNQKWDDASINIQEALKQRPKWDEAKVLWAGIMEAQGNPQKAQPIFEKLVRENPDTEENYLKLAQTLVEQKKYNEAVVVLRRWTARKPDSVAGHFYIAVIEANYLKSPNEALKEFQKVLEIEPDNVRVRQQIAQIYLNQSKYKEALDQFLMIRQRFPNDLGVELQVALLYQELGQVDASILILKNILKTNPDADRVYYYLGLILEKQKRYSEAIEYFSKVPKTSSVFKESVLREVTLYGVLKDNEGAKKALRDAIRKDPKVPQFYQFLSILLESDNEIDKAIDVLKQGTKEIPNDETLYFGLGILYDKKKKKDLALQAMQKVVEINPQNSAALNYIGYTYADEGKNLDQAEALVKQALQLKPGDPYIMDSLGWVYFKRGELDKARLYIQKGLQIAPKEPTLLEHMGDVSLKEGKKKEALSYYKKSLQVFKSKKEANPEDLKRVQEKIQNL